MSSLSPVNSSEMEELELLWINGSVELRVATFFVALENVLNVIISLSEIV
jgi:hypothetical protein